MNHSPSRWKARKFDDRGFSMLELLIAIGVVSILAVLIAFSIGATQQKARSLDCHSKLRSIGVGLAAYIQDNGGYPGLRIDATPRFWNHILVPYMTGRPAPVKSADLSIVPDWMWCKARASGSADRSFGYGYNQYFGNIPPGSADSSPNSPFNRYWHLKPSMVESPSEKVVIGDNHDLMPANTFFDRALHNGSAVTNPLRARRHSGGGHYLFADGHVEHLSAMEMGQRLQRDDKRIFKPYETVE